MSDAIENLESAFRKAMETRPKVGGFPHLAESLRRAGVMRNVWTLPSCQSLYVMEACSVVSQLEPIVTGFADVPTFDEATLIKAIRTDQAGESTFPEFLSSAWKAGVVWYEVDFSARTVTYCGAAAETYVESYPAVEI